MDGIIVEKIPVKGLFKKTVEVKFWFGMWVWIAIAEKHNVAFEDMGTIDDNIIVNDALFFAANWAAYKDNAKRIKESDVEKWVNTMPYSQFKRIIDCMMESKIGGKSIIKLSEESKKKQVQKK